MLEGAIGFATGAVLAAAGLIALFWILRLRAQLRAAITARRLAEDKLEIVECIAEVGTWEVDSRDRRIDWSQHLFAIHGRDPKRGTPSMSDAIDYFHPDDREMLTKAVTAALEDGDDFEFHGRVIDEAGQMRHILVRGAARFRDGKVAGIFGSAIEMRGAWEPAAGNNERQARA